MTNLLHDLLGPQAITIELAAQNKKQLFRELAERFAPELGCSPEAITDVLSERERLGSTGFGGGVAIPHGKMEALDSVRAFLAVMRDPVDYAAIDDMPVDIVVLLLSPRDAGTEHLKALARVSRALRDRDFLAKLRGAGSPDAIYALISTYQARDAA
jgi:PTS system nitrogen regulatory IIA component